MCEYDFEYYVEDHGLLPYVPTHGTKCDCGHIPELGEIVRPWTQDNDIDNWELCELCEGEGNLFVVDDYGNEVDDYPKQCNGCLGEGSVQPPDFELAFGFFCQRCDIAKKILHVWCDGQFGWSQIPRQLNQHWHEDSLYRSFDFAKIVTLSSRHWKKSLASDKISTDELKSLVDKVLMPV